MSDENILYEYLVGKKTKSSNEVRIFKSFFEPRLRFNGLCMQGDLDVEEMWKCSEQIFSFLIGTHWRCSKNSPIRDLIGLGAVEKGGPLRDILAFLLPSVEDGGLSFCELSLCAYPNCSRSICFEHGWGVINEDVDEFQRRKCMDCDNQFCWLHFEDIVKECDVCRND